MNVLVVDDEPIIRIGLRTLIDWEGNGMRLVGEASDGEEALKWMDAEQVDLLVTDIKMPRMDGLELIRHARERTDDIGIVVLSCLDDFGFVKEAMKLGARDYILKPLMEPEELVSILHAIGEDLAGRRQEKARIRELNERLAQSRPYRLQAKLLRFFEQGEADGDLESELFRPGMSLYSMGLFMPPGIPSPLGEAQLEDVMLAVRLQEQQYLLLLECKRSLSANEWYQTAYAAAEKLLREWTAFAGEGTPPIICVAPPLTDLQDLPGRSELHRQQYAERFYGLTEAPIVMDQPQSATAAEPVMPLAARNDLLRAVAGGNFDAMLDAMLTIRQQLAAEKPDLQRLFAFVFETVGLLIGYARENGYRGIEEFEQHYLSMELTSSHTSFASMSRWLDRLMDDLRDSHQGYNVRRDVQNPFIRKALAYIHQNYSNNIGTADIAEHVRLSRSYLSDLYSKEMGESLTETLARVRIEEACRLLAATDLKVYEIAEKVGFNDSKTFTRAFKRLKGCSPKEYPLSNK